MEDEAEVEALLTQIALAKQKELRLRAEKKRIRDELGQLQAGTLWSREEQTQKQLLEVRRAKEQLEAQKKAEETKLGKLGDDLKEQELRFRKGVNAKSSPFQQAAVTSLVVTTATNSYLSDGTLDQKENASVLAKATDDTIPLLSDKKLKPVPDAVISTEDTHALVGNQAYDALQNLIRNINCDEQQKRIERLQAELVKANSRRQDIACDESSLKLARRSSMTSDDNMYQEHDFSDGIGPGSIAKDSRHRAPVREAANKIIHLEPLDDPQQPSRSPDASPASATQLGENTPQLPPLQSTVLSSATTPQFVLPGYPPGYPMPTATITPFPFFSPPILPVNPYGIGYPSPYFPGCTYPAPPPWYPSGASYPYQIGDIPSTEQSPKSVLHQQEEDIRRLERELVMQRITNEQQAEAKEFAQLQGRLQELQTKISTLAIADNSTVAPVDGVAVNDTENSGLKILKIQHLENLTKVRNERDLLEEQEKLEEMKERIQRRREEKKRELDHEDWIAKQKRELVTLRLQRAVQSNDTKTGVLRTDLSGNSLELYSPERGFVLLWDFVTGVPAIFNDLQITYAVFEGQLIRTPFKVVVAKETKMTDPQHKLCLFLTSRHIKSLAAASDIRMFIEVSQSGANGLRAPTSLGWAAFDIFKQTSEEDFALARGSFKLPVKQSSMPDPSKTLVLPPTIGDCGDIRVYIRLVHGDHAEEASLILVDPELHAARYQMPETGMTLPRPQSMDAIARRPSVQRRSTPNDKAALAKPVDDQKVTTPPASTRQMPVPPPSATLQKQDFLDVDRLHLLSSASSRPPSTRPRSNIPPTGDRPRLPPFREDADTDEPWIRVDKTIELQRRLLGGNPFQPGDGFNVYVDGGRGYPDSVTISKVTIAALHADRTQVVTENGSAFAAATSDVFDPAYDAYVEYRQNNFNPTLTLVIRVDTIELHSKRPVIVGYSVFPVFLDSETHDQPNRPSIPRFILNEGGFQLPLHSQVQSADANLPLSAKSCEDFPRIPCGTVLLRISPAKLSGDGLTLLSRKDYPPIEWEAKGLLVPAPQYCDQCYDSLRCVPSGIEEKIYSIRHKSRKPKTIAQCLQQMSLNIGEARDMLKSKPSNFLDLRSALRYEPAIGFRVAVDTLHNVKAKGGAFFKVLFSVHPPGSFYQAIRLTAGVYFTTTMDWISAQSSPEFGDGYLTLRDAPGDQLLVVLFDVRSVTRHPKTGAITSQQYGWTFLPVLADTRSVNACTIQLPLFRGEVNLNMLKAAAGGLSALVDDIGNEKVKQLVPVAEDGASLFVRVQDPQLPHLASQPIINASLSKMIPPRLGSKYAYDSTKIAALKKKTPLSKLVPSDTSEKQFEKELNQAFAQEMDIHHLLF